MRIAVLTTVVLLAGAFAGPFVLRELCGFTESEIAEAKCREYYDAAVVWERVKEEPPDSLEAMASPLNPGEQTFIRVEDDPWGNLYVIEIKIEGLLVRSFGPDGKRGTADDIIFAGREKQRPRALHR